MTSFAPPVCPFVAFAEDRSHRAAVPDQRHHCHAPEESIAISPRHQERYCLKAEFPGCPIFRSWAASTAARPEGTDEPAPEAIAAAAAVAVPEVVASPPRVAAVPRPAAPGPAVAPVPVAPTAPVADEVVLRSTVTEPLPPYPAARRSGPSGRGLAIGLAALALVALASYLLPGFLSQGDRRPGTAVGSPAGTLGSPVGASTPTPRPTPSPTPSPSPTPTPRPPPTEPPQPTAQSYVVAPGDSLCGIAAQFGVTGDELLAANPQVTDPDRILVGDTLTIPVPDSGGEPGTSVEPGC